MSIRARDLRALLRDLRGLGALVLVLSLLVYANTVAIADSAESAFRSTAFAQDADLTSMLAAHHADLVRYALLEYASLVVGVLGVILVLAGPGLKRALRP